MKTSNYFLLAVIAALSSCVGDDVLFDEVEPKVRITNKIDSLANGSEYQFEYLYTNNIGIAEDAPVTWSSSDDAIVEVSPLGLARAKRDGMAVIRAQVSAVTNVVDEILIHIGSETVTQAQNRSGTIKTTSSYLLEGGFIVTVEGDDLIIAIGDDYRASRALPGLYLYMSNNRNSINGAKEIAAVETFSGAHQYRIRDTGIDDFAFLLYYCKPFNIKVGDGEIQ